jgi:hypothetical protein
MLEPDNHTAWVDAGGDTWVRVDEFPVTSYGIPRSGPWWPLTDGPGWEPQVRGGIGTPRPWHQVDGLYGPLTPADPERTARAIARVHREVTT